MLRAAPAGAGPWILTYTSTTAFGGAARQAGFYGVGVVHAGGASPTHLRPLHNGHHKKYSRAEPHAPPVRQPLHHRGGLDRT